MKKIIQLSLCAAMIVMACQATAANTGSYLDIKLTGNKAFELIANNIKGDVSIALRDSKDQIIFRRSVKNNGSLSKHFDMDLFSDGNYKIELVDSEKVQIVPLSITNDLLVVNHKESNILYIPILSQRENLVSINMLAINGEALSIKVRNDSNELVHEKTLDGKASLGQIYDFSKSPSGKYEFQLISGDQVFTRLVSIK